MTMARLYPMTALLLLRPTCAFLSSAASRNARLVTARAASTSRTPLSTNISRLETLQTLLQKYGAPGSVGCAAPNDLQPITDTPELVTSLESLSDLHPYLFPIAQSQSTSNLLCAYRNPSTEESNKEHPWPIVETRVGSPGFSLLSLQSEDLMRRIAAHCDASNDAEGLALYNDDTTLPFAPGSVAQLGYGLDKYILLRVGPFPDLYQAMAQQHTDEQSSLIAAEAANAKLGGFASNFLYYAQLLASWQHREEEARDAARQCLRLPLPTIGWEEEDWKQVAVLGQMAKEGDSLEVCRRGMKEMYEKIREAEKEENPTGRTVEQAKLEEINALLDQTALAGAPWSSVRPQLIESFREIGRDEMASFVEHWSST